MGRPAAAFLSDSEWLALVYKKTALPSHSHARTNAFSPKFNLPTVKKSDTLMRCFLVF
jgi:hypothetical protein